MRRLLTALGILLALVALITAATEMGRYVVRAAWEEGKILARRRPIEQLITDSTTSPAVARRLELVLAARAFARDSLGFKTGESFTTFSQLDRDTLVLVVSASRRDTLAAHTWWFPVVGRFPYKGFFDPAQALQTAADMRAAGFDTYVRPASAFSTLGWFDDPLMSTTLRQDSAGLANTVIHELLHNTLFVKGKVAFNESFATFAGARGAIEFFESRGDTALAERAHRDWEDDKLLATFWAATVHSIDSVLAIPGRDSVTRIRERDSVYARMRRVLTRDIAPRLTTVDTSRLAAIQLDNASVIARRTYATDLYLFDEVHRRAGGRVKATVGVVATLVKTAPDPWEAMRQWTTSSK